MIRAALASLAVLLLAAGVASAQETLVVQGPSPALVTLGSSAYVTIEIVGASADPRPPKLPRVPGLRLALEGPSRQSSTTIIGGRRRSEVKVTYRLVLVPARTGHFVVPEFTMWTGTREQSVRQLEFDVERDLRGAELGFLNLVAQPSRVYEGEPVTFVFDYGVDDRLEITAARARGGQTFFNAVINAPWFSDPEGVVPVEGVDEIDGGDVCNLVLNQSLVRVALTRGFEREGKRYNRFTFTRTFAPTEPGKLSIDAPTLSFEVAVGRRRVGIFGERQTETHHVYGEPVEIEVLPIPSEARPADYSGAIGRFAIEASVDKRTVRVGDSAKLTLSIRGQGNTEFFEPPEFPSNDAFHVLGRNVQRERGLVEVTYDLTPLRVDVDEVPAIGWSYFDTTPGVERFVQVATESIPLRVEPPAEGEGLATLPGEDDAAVVAGVDDIWDMKPIETNAAIPPSRPSTASSAALAVFTPWALCALVALWFRRRARRRADVAGRRAAGAAKRFQKAFAADPLDALVAYLADRLGVADAAVIGPDLSDRLASAGVESELARAVQEAVDAGTAARYGGGEGLDAARARELVGRLESVSLAPPAAVMLACVLGLATLAPAQGDPVVSEAEAAYRRGDYAEAAAGFAEASAREGADRRLLYNLGNALYREGEYAEALVAYERARLAMPRDPELLSNIALVERKLDLTSAEGEPFLQTLVELRERFTPFERLLAAVLANLAAALCLVFGRRIVRWIGVGLLIPAVVFAAEVVWLAPSRPPRAIITAPRVDLVAEPRAGLEPVLKLRRGVRVELVGESEAWASVRVDGRRGYIPSGAIGVVR